MPEFGLEEPYGPLGAVSRETLDRLSAFEALVLKWTERINLISPRSAADIRRRHTCDSAQLLDLAPAGARSWVDLGSGGGFPGLVVAIIASERRPTLGVTLVESDTRKCAFLGAANRALGLDATILNQRAEASGGHRADIVSARALAPLEKLIALALPWRTSDGVFLFSKGASVDEELTEARKCWHMDFERLPSSVDPDASVLRIKECRRAR